MQSNKPRNFPRLVFIMKKLFKNEKKLMKIKKRLEKGIAIIKKLEYDIPNINLWIHSKALK